jgi:methylthioribulose-1-phosphate dehydratase
VEVEVSTPVALAARLANSAKSFHDRGWVLGTSGNFSAVANRDPLQLVITASGRHKGELGGNDFLVVDGAGTPISGESKPSAETLIHLSIVKAVGAGAVFHTHSIWSTLLSDAQAGAGSLTIEGYEMLKGLSGVATHLHSEAIPILENTQDYPMLVGPIRTLLTECPETHCFLLRRHGLYTWGKDPLEAHRHVEILEFLLEAEGRRHFGGVR